MADSTHATSTPRPVEAVGTETPVRLSTQIAILGGGFAGSLAALVLRRAGFDVAVLDAGKHPRFAIGESSTPITNLLLRDLATRYDLPQLLPLCQYGSWRARHPNIMRGLKRGFSYFRHRPQQEFQSSAAHDHELLVAASTHDDVADTHWMRADFDAYLFQQARDLGIPCWSECRLDSVTRNKVWQLQGTRAGTPWQIQARFVIDATGASGGFLSHLGINQTTHGLNTNSWSIFAHFAGLRPWAEVLDELHISRADHPFRCDDAAQHQVLDEGWMWQLRFDNDVTSAGFALDGRVCPPTGLPAREQWQMLMSRYPSLQWQFESAEIVNPPQGLVQSPRLQRRAEQLVGNGWAALPNTAGFIDPLHSPGNAQVLCGIERLTSLLVDHWGLSSLAKSLRWYETQCRLELALVDDLVCGGYDSLRRFPCFVAQAMVYFAGATTYERLRTEGRLPTGAAFLRADHTGFRRAAREIRRALLRALADTNIASADAEFERTVQRLIAPYNEVGLLDSPVPRMYARTAVVG